MQKCYYKKESSTFLRIPTGSLEMKRITEGNTGILFIYWKKRLVGRKCVLQDFSGFSRIFSGNV